MTGTASASLAVLSAAFRRFLGIMYEAEFVDVGRTCFADTLCVTVMARGTGGAIIARLVCISFSVVALSLRGIIGAADAGRFAVSIVTSIAVFGFPRGSAGEIATTLPYGKLGREIADFSSLIILGFILFAFADCKGSDKLPSNVWVDISFAIMADCFLDASSTPAPSRLLRSNVRERFFEGFTEVLWLRCLVWIFEVLMFFSLLLVFKLLDGGSI